MKESRFHLSCLLFISFAALLVARTVGESPVKSTVGTSHELFASRRLRSISSSYTTRVLLSTVSSSTAAPSSAAANDDMFRTSERMKSAKSEQSQRFESFLKAGGCDNIECRVFLLVGYVTVGVGIAAAYRLARSAEWRLPPSVSQYERRVGGGQSVYDDEMTMAYRRKQWDDSKTVN